MESTKTIPLNQVQKFDGGAFGDWKQGRWLEGDREDPNVLVHCAKKDSASILEGLRKEAADIIQIKHSSFLCLLGLEALLAMMIHEDVRSIIKLQMDKRRPIILEQLYKYLIQLAKGLQHLDFLNIAHGEICAKNVFINWDCSQAM